MTVNHGKLGLQHAWSSTSWGRLPMDGVNRIEQALDEALSRAETSGAPPRLGMALRHAVFPGGARIRPRLCPAVAHPCGIEDAGSRHGGRRIDRTAALRVAGP